MFSLINSAVFALALAHTAVAGVYITSPVAQTIGTGGQTIYVKWADDGENPSVAEIGPCSIDICVGNVNTQTFLQNLAASVDVSKTSEILTTIDGGIGEDGDYYCVRFTSLGLKNTKNPQYPYQSFSAKFTVNQLHGQFNATVLAQINDSSAPAPSRAAAVSVSIRPSASKSATSTSASASPARSTGAATSTYGISTLAVLAFAGLASYIPF